MLLTTLDEAVANQTRPVHINCMYREPLYPSEMNGSILDSESPYLRPLQTWLQHARPFTQYGKSEQLSSPSEDAIMRFVHGKGVIIAGTLTPEQDPAQLIALSQRLVGPC